MNNNSYIIRRLEESGSYYGRSFSNRYMNWKRFYSISKSFQRELKRLKDMDRPIKVLDMGCGDGWMIYRLKAGFEKEYSLDFVGIDISELDINFANERKKYFSRDKCEFKTMDVNNLSFNDQGFDIIISSEVIEHIQTPEILIKDLFRILKKCGLVILTTPQQGGGILARLLRFTDRLSFGLIRRYAEKDENDVISDKERYLSRLSSSEGKTGSGLDHVSVKNTRQWKRIFRDNGFIIQSVQGTSGMLFGGPYLDNHRILFGLSVILDVLTQHLPLSYLWSESLFFELRKI